MSTIKEMVESRKEEIISRIRTLVSYESVQAAANNNHPFGDVVAACLDEALKMCEADGFKTTNLDYYCGFAEIGEGEKLIGMLGHLDVVPLGSGWTHDPLGGEIVDGTMFGRGVIDDKGPVVCAMTALKIVKELRPNINKRIRLIMGCNEETGSRCLAHYVEKEGHIDYGFTPDGSFPGVFGEKGHLSLKVSAKTNIVFLKAGVAGNVVPNHAEAEVVKGSYDAAKLDAYFKANNIKYEVKVNERNGNDLIEVTGVAAHASMPELGRNALSYLMMALHEAGYDDDFVRFYVSHVGLTTDGSLMGIACHDEYGALTFNVGIADTVVPNEVFFLVDCRFPVSMKSAKVVEPLEIGSVAPDISVEVTRRSEPLFYERHSDLVEMLHSSYKEVTGKDDEPLTMGGGTYAQGIRNCIAFGAEFPGWDYHMHDADEFVPVDQLLLQTEIYVNALLKLIDYEG